MPGLNPSGVSHLCITNGTTTLASIRQGGLSTDLDGNRKIDFKELGILGENWSAGN